MFSFPSTSFTKHTCLDRSFFCLISLLYFKKQSKEINIYRQLNIANKIRWLSILLINPYQNDSQIDYY